MTIKEIIESGIRGGHKGIMNKHKEEILESFKLVSSKFENKKLSEEWLMDMLDIYAEEMLMECLPDRKEPDCSENEKLDCTPTCGHNSCRQRTLDNFKKLKDE